MELHPFAGVLALVPLFLLVFVLYIFWSILQTLRSIDRSMADVAKNLRNPGSNGTATR